MNNKLVIIVLATVVVATGAIWLALSKKNSAPGGFGVPNPPQEANTQDASKPTDEPANKPADNAANDFNGTLTDLMATAVPSKCNAEFVIDGKTQKQMIYFDGKNLRSEMVMDMGGIENNVFVLVKDGWEYVWSKNSAADVAPMAMKMKFSGFEPQKNPEAPPAQGGAMDANQKMNFSCTPWAVDASLFELPAGIEFHDFTAAVQESLANSPQSICDACDLIPDAGAKAECQKANCKK